MEKLSIFNVYNLIYQQNKGAVVAPPFLLPSGETSLVCFCIIKDGIVLKALFYDAETLKSKGDVSVKTNLVFENVRLDTSCYLQKFNKVLELMIVDPDNAKGSYSDYLNDFTGFRYLASFAAASYPKMVTNITLFVLLNVKESRFLEEKVMLWRKRITFDYAFNGGGRDDSVSGEAKNINNNALNEIDKSKESSIKDNVNNRSGAKNLQVERSNGSASFDKKNTRVDITNKADEAISATDDRKKMSLIEQVSPKLVVYNTAVSKILGRGIFRYNIFENCKNFFLECVEKEAEILSKIYKENNKDLCLTVTELPNDLKELKDGQIYSVTNRSLSNAEIDIINHADIYVFADGGNEHYNVNVFDLSEAGLIILEKTFEKNGFELQCNFKSIASYNRDIYGIPGEVLLNNTILSHFSRRDNYTLTDEDFEWIKDYKVNKEHCGDVSIEGIEEAKKSKNFNSEKSHTEETETTNNNTLEEITSGVQTQNGANDNCSNDELIDPLPINNSSEGMNKKMIESENTSSNEDANQMKNVTSTNDNMGAKTSELIIKNEPIKEDKNSNLESTEETHGNDSEDAEQQPKDTEIRENNISIKAKILKENNNLIGRLRASRNAVYGPILSAYQKAKDDGDYEFLGATYCSKNFEKTDPLFKTDGYKLIYDTEKTVKQLLGKIVPVSRNVCCFGCRQRWEQDVTFDKDGIKQVKCPNCDMPVGVEV